jgi:CHAD domain-containing protein
MPALLLRSPEDDPESVAGRPLPDRAWGKIPMTATSKWVQAARNDLVFQVAAQSLEGRLAAVLHYLPLAAEHAAEDLEHVHQLRVWTRRATAAIRLYRDLVPWSRAVRLKEHLSLLRRACGEARDLDVMAARLALNEDDPGAAHLLERVRGRRAESQQPLLDAFSQLDGGAKFERHMRKFIKKVRQRSKTDKLHAETFGRWARKNVRPYVEQFLMDGRADFSNIEAIHRFRISGKKLRYTMELLAAGFPPRFERQLYPRVEKLQDRLGRINDLATALTRFEHWLQETTEPAEKAHLEKLLDEERQQLDEARTRFLTWWTPERLSQFANAFDRLILGRKHRGEISGRMAS